MLLNIASDGCLSDDELKVSLEKIFAGIDKREIVVAYGRNGQASIAALGPAGQSRDARTSYLQTGCLTKLLTATLLERALSQGKIAEHGDVTAHLPRSVVGNVLRGITISHLLNHTHGLDDSRRKVVPRRRGFIDLTKLVSEYENRLSCPGEIYSYSNAGARLIAAMLERAYRMAYTDILMSELFDPLRIELRLTASETLDVSEVCPARGGTLSLLAVDLLRFLGSAVERKQFWPDASDPSRITPIPGWNPFERGVFRGWKCFGDGWFGHSAVTEDQRTAIVRVYPERKIVIVIASAYQHANMVAAKLFGKSLPGFRSLRIPKPLRGEALKAVDWDAFCGNYRNAAEAFSIRPCGRESIEIVGSSYEVELTVAEDNILLPKRAEHAGMGFVQLLKPHHGLFRYLWDGQRLYRNELDQSGRCLR